MSSTASLTKCLISALAADSRPVASFDSSYREYNFILQFQLSPTVKRTQTAVILYQSMILINILKNEMFFTASLPFLNSNNFFKTIL